MYEKAGLFLEKLGEGLTMIHMHIYIYINY